MYVLQTEHFSTYPQICKKGLLYRFNAVNGVHNLFNGKVSSRVIYI